MRRRLTVSIAAAAAVVSLSTALQASAESCCAPPPPPPTYPVRPFKAVSGSGTTSTAGTVTFYARSVRVVGQVDAHDEDELGVRSCRYVSAFTGSATGYSPIVCGSGEPIRFDVPANRVGGATKVVITLYYTGSGQSYAVGSDTVYR